MSAGGSNPSYTFSYDSGSSQFSYNLKTTGLSKDVRGGTASQGVGSKPFGITWTRGSASGWSVSRSWAVARDGVISAAQAATFRRSHVRCASAV